VSGGPDQNAPLAPGDRGDHVRELQERLASMGQDVTPDGVYGDVTAEAIRAVQRHHGLQPTGVADEQTDKAITAEAEKADQAAPGTVATIAAPRSGRLIVNETNKRIVITCASGLTLVLSPLERRTIGDDDFKAFKPELQKLERLCIVALPPPEPTDKDEAILGFGVIAVVAYGIAGFVVSNMFFWIAGALVLTVGFVVAQFVARTGARAAGRWAGQIVALIVVLLIGIVLPGGALYFSAGVDDLVKEAYFDGTRSHGQIDLTLLGRGLQLLFMTAASLLPALLYFLFDRQQLRTLREQFERHMFRLDRTVDSLSDIRAKYGTLLGETYGATPSSQGGRLLPGRRSPVLVATIVITFGWLVTLLNPDVGLISDRAGILGLFHPERSALIFGFLGSYFFALQMIQRGYARGDLRPKTYTQITVRILMVTILAWVLELLPGPDDAPYLLAVAFIAGIVPETALVRIQEYVNRGARRRPSIRGIVELDPLTKLEGIDLYDRARLLDEGVSNVEGLAHHDLIELMLQTRIPAPRLVDWIDQAILYLHVGSSDVEGEPSRDVSLGRLRAFGIRTATDLEQAHRGAVAQGEKDLGEFLQILPRFDGLPDIPRITVILTSISDEEWMQNLRWWHDPVLVEETFVWPPVTEESAGNGEAPARRRTRTRRAAAGATPRPAGG
jgi:hypothetical protein